MLRITLLIVSLASGFWAFSQLETNYWFFGTRGGLDFSCHPPMPIVGVSHNIQEGCASISDADGNFLFTTNGDIVWDRNFNPMPNGSGLSGFCSSNWNSNTQPAIIVPDPANIYRYFVFTTDCVEDTLSGGFRYSIVDMTENGGMGDVILRDQLLYTPTCEKVTATTNDNGGYWVVSHEFGTNRFFAYEVTPSGVSGPVISSTGQIHNYTPISAPIPVNIPEQVGRGTLKFSPAGDKLISLSTPDDWGYDSCYVIHPEIFDFDKTTGIITSGFMIQHPDSLAYYGAAFSVDGSKLYLSGAWYHPNVHQFDLSLSTPDMITNSRTPVNVSSVPPYIHQSGAIALANDGKIYLATGGDWLNIIHSPNDSGANCGFEFQGVMLRDCPLPVWSNWSLPNFIQSYFAPSIIHDNCSDHITADFNHSNACVNEVVQFNDQSTIFPETIQQWSWNFGDPASGAANFSNLQDPVHLFTAPGSYQVELVVQTDLDPVCKIDSITYTVVVEACTGIFEEDVNRFQIFPNPSENYFTLSLPTTSFTDLKLYDPTGKFIWSDQGYFDRLEFGHDLASGIYFLRVAIEDHTKYFKIVKK